MTDEQQAAIVVQGIHKEFVLPQSKNSSLKQAAVNIVRKNKKVTNKVLDGINFKVNKGDFLGIIGRNGSGKSTLLKLIAGVYEPTAGNIHVYGGLTPFIELGVGFNPELSGHDNVYLNGALLGFDHKQVDEMYDEIVEFAELGPFMDQKLKNYSSGMQVRLAFSIAIKAENDILLFDEVLAVGDSNFQEKCIRQFKKFKREKKTIILVTHSMDMVDKFCNRAILLDSGKIVFDGGAAEAIDKYEALNMIGSPKEVAVQRQDTPDKDSASYQDDGQIRIADVELINKDSREIKIVNSLEGFSVKFSIESKIVVNKAYLVVLICESENVMPIARFDSRDSKKKIRINQGLNEVVLMVDESPFLRGKYYILVSVYDGSDKNTRFDHYNGMLDDNFFLIKGEKKAGIIEVQGRWEN